MKNLKVAAYIILFIIILGLFWQLIETFYQQDEWLALGNIFTYGRGYFFLSSPSLLHMLLGEGRLASRAIAYLLVGGFPFNVVPLVAFAIIFHTTNTLLVYNLANKFFKNAGYSFAAASFFAVNGVAHQAVTWPAAVVGTLPATTLLLLSFFAYFKAIESFSKRWIIATIALIYASFHFKEIGLFLLLFLPLATFFLRPEFFYRKFKFLLYLVVPFLLIISYKVIGLRLRTTESNLYITGLQENFFSTILLRTVLYPLTSFSLMFVPGDYFLSFARSVLRQIYPFFSNLPSNILIAQTVILDLLAVILTVSLLLIIYIFLRKENPRDKKIVMFWLAFSFMAFTPYVLLSKDFAYLESRFYYLPAVGGALLLSWLFKRSWRSFGTKILFVLMPLYVFYLVMHAGVVRGAISEQIAFGNLRRELIGQIEDMVPILDSNRNVFYIVSDRDFYAQGNKVPFQQGTGYTLMVLYRGSGKIPLELFKEEFLFEIGSQGYKEAGGLGFGYFWDKEELDEAIKLHGLSPESIITLQYNFEEKRLTRVGSGR